MTHFSNFFKLKVQAVWVNWLRNRNMLDWPKVITLSNQYINWLYQFRSLQQLGSVKCDNIANIITLTSDNIRRLSLYCKKRLRTTALTADLFFLDWHWRTLTELPWWFSSHYRDTLMRWWWWQRRHKLRLESGKTFFDVAFVKVCRQNRCSTVKCRRFGLSTRRSTKWTMWRVLRSTLATELSILGGRRTEIIGLASSQFYVGFLFSHYDLLQNISPIWASYICTGWFNFKLEPIFTTSTPSALKFETSCKNSQKWRKNNHLATLIDIVKHSVSKYIQVSLTICHGFLLNSCRTPKAVF